MVNGWYAECLRRKGFLNINSSSLYASYKRGIKEMIDENPSFIVKEGILIYSKVYTINDF